jgi:mannose-1-phosphate guanylyltransferase / mannose-6-phosphate isomerase
VKITPIVLAGGSGTRLWPLSRNQYPKQYLPLVSKNTLLQETLLRLEGLSNLTPPVIICNRDHRFLVADQLEQINVNNPTILLEPIGKNTAPAIAVGAFQSLKMNSNSILLVLSADHVISDIDSFYASIEVAIEQASKGNLVTFGITPKNPNTGYGYIRASKMKERGAYKVEKFTEKPDFETAISYMEDGNYFWNSGMFVFQAIDLIKELKFYCPNIVKIAKTAIDKSLSDLDFIRLDEKSFRNAESISIDYALMEKSENVSVVELDAGWSDIGSWSALHDIGEKTREGNVIKGDVCIKDTFNTYVNASNHLVATIGIKDLVIVDTPNATLVSTKEKAHEVSKIVEKLNKLGRNEPLTHRKVFRPWGWFDSIAEGPLFQVKRLHVNPGAKLSIQMHYKRAEHWVVVCGVAKVINGDKILTLCEGESTYIPIETKHSLENETKGPLEIIEVQSGSYLGEDDIVRFEDIYGRISDIG